MNIRGIIFVVESNEYGSEIIKSTRSLGYHIWNITHSYDLQTKVQEWAESSERKIDDEYNGIGFTVHVVEDKFENAIRKKYSDFFYEAYIKTQGIRTKNIIGIHCCTHAGAWVEILLYYITICFIVCSQFWGDS